MTRLRALAACTLALAGLFGPAIRADEPAKPAEANVRARAAAYVVAWNRHQPVSLGLEFTEDAEVQVAGGRLLRGRSEIVGWVATGHLAGGRLVGLQAKLARETLQSLTATSADAKWEIEFTGPSASAPQAGTPWPTSWDVELRKTEAGWRVKSLRPGARAAEPASPRGGPPGATPPPESPSVPTWAKVSPEQLAEARKLAVPVAFETKLGLRFVLIPGGTFLMGSPESEAGREADEGPQHKVEVAAIYISTTEVSNSQFRAFQPGHISRDTDTWDTEEERNSPRYSLNGDTQPVTKLGAPDARAFARWLSGRESGALIRLPTEAEWERACRAGTSTRWSFGDDIHDLAKYANVADKNDPQPTEELPFLDDGFAVTAPVGSLLPNPWGLYDMHGNVSEFCLDWFSPYTAMDQKDPRGPETGTLCVVRGGSRGVFPHLTRSAERSHILTPYGSHHLGFRLARELPSR